MECAVKGPALTGAQADWGRGGGSYRLVSL